MIAPNLLAERIRKVEALAAAPGTVGEGEARRRRLSASGPGCAQCRHHPPSSA